MHNESTFPEPLKISLLGGSPMDHLFNIFVDTSLKVSLHIS